MWLWPPSDPIPHSDFWWIITRHRQTLLTKAPSNIPALLPSSTRLTSWTTTTRQQQQQQFFLRTWTCWPSSKVLTLIALNGNYEANQLEFLSSICENRFFVIGKNWVHHHIRMAMAMYPWWGCCGFSSTVSKFLYLAIHHLGVLIGCWTFQAQDVQVNFNLQKKLQCKN